MIHFRQSPGSKMTRVKHNCASLCNELERLDFSIRNINKHNTAFLNSLRFEKIRTMDLPNTAWDIVT